MKSKALNYRRSRGGVILLTLTVCLVLALPSCAIYNLKEFDFALDTLALYEGLASLSKPTATTRQVLPLARKEAEARFQAWLRSHPKSYSAYHYLGQLHEYNENHERYGPGFDKDKVIFYYAEALKLKPDYVPSHINLGWIYRLLGRTDDAIRHLTRARELSPTEYLAAVNLAVAYLDKGMAEQAREAFEAFLRAGKPPQSSPLQTFEDVLRTYRPSPAR